MQRQRVQTLSQNRFLLLDDTTVVEKKPEKRSDKRPGKSNSIQRSRQTYRDVSRQVSAFYENKTETDQIERLKKQVNELQERLDSTRRPSSDPMDVMERSYRLAARYLNPTKESSDTGPMLNDERPEDAIIHTQPPQEQTVSFLPQREKDSLSEKPLRNFGFITAVGQDTLLQTKPIRACIDGDQVVKNGSPVQLRLLEKVRIGRYEVPANSVVSATARVEGQRMGLTVSNIVCGGEILPVQLIAHDLDGGRGLNIPNSTEREALKEAAASIGSNFGQSISFTRNAGQQAAMDAVRGAMTGGSQYLAAKVREVKITLKANYRLLLIPKN